MSGDCGHGWGYHYDGASGPCYKCMGWAAPVKSEGSVGIQHEFRRLSREIARLKAKARSAHDLQIAAQTRAHDLKLRAKTAEYSLRGLCQREQALKSELDLAHTEIKGHIRIEDDLKKLVQGWIPVSEGLPVNTETVVFLSDGLRCMGHYAADNWWDNRVEEFPACKVTHWMPLPPAPRGG